MLVQEVTWQAFLDIFLFAAGIFFLYRTLVNLGTWKIFYGILVAAAFFILASLFDLKGIEWVYKNVSQVAVLSLIVIFQPELRKIFEKAAFIRRVKSKNFDERFAGILAESVAQLAKNGIGAIIVIPGEEPVEEWISGGFPLNGEPSKPLILSIFDPNSPGHDGALILQDGMFTQFGVRLPVSRSGRLSEEYGTRHQAAMGLCEKTDALIIVVSEERKQISLFQRGFRKPVSDQADIIQKIISHCRDTGFFEKLKPDNRKKKVMLLEIAASIIAASVLWFAIISDQGEVLERVVTVPVEYTATTDDVMMTGEKAKEARLHLSGARSDINAVSPNSMSVKIDLAKAAAGRQTILLSKENISLPKGVKLLDIEPPNVEINIVKLIKVRLPVKPQLVGTLSSQYRLKSIEVKPNEIEVLIPSGKDGKSHREITTTPVYLENIQKNMTLFCKIISSPVIQPVDKQWPDVELNLVIEPVEKPKQGS